jgi:ketosteroid isomerase-like protein
LRRADGGTDPVDMTETSTSQSIEIVLRAFEALERRDDETLDALYHPEVSFHWPPSLAAAVPTRTWEEAWDPLQPTQAERRLSPRVVAASEREVVVLWRQRGRRPDGEAFDGECLGLYEVRDGKFARAQMFYFDTVAVIDFLAAARGGAGPPTAA